MDMKSLNEEILKIKSIMGLKENMIDHTEEQRWYDMSDPKEQEKMFVWDTKEYLTGYFGTIGLENEKKVMANLLKIFREAKADIHQHGTNPDYRYVNAICKYMGFKRIKTEFYPNGEYEEYEMVHDIIDLNFNGE